MDNRDFPIPPVIFPSGNTPAGTSATSGAPHRRVATAPFQNPRSSIPFMSFDMNSASSASTSFSVAGGGPPIGGHGSSSFEDEEPLLDELGIHPDQIWRKTRSILNPFRVNAEIHRDSSDLSGPILLYILLCLFQLLAGKIQFGVVLGWIVVASIFLYVVFNMLAGRGGNLDLHTCTSVVGYSMLPVVILAAAGLFLPQAAAVRVAAAAVFVVWSTRACSGLMVALADGGDEHRGLVAYAAFLIYTLFSLLVIF